VHKQIFVWCISCSECSQTSR